MDYSIHADGLNDILSSECLSRVTNDSFNNFDVRTNLENFISNDSVLQGEQWSAVREKLNQYSIAFDMRSQAASNLSSAINDAVNMMLDYLGDDLYIDPSKLDELKLTKSQCEQQIAELEAQMSAMTYKPIKDENGKIRYIKDYLYSAGQRAAAAAAIASLRNETIVELNRLITKIEGLKDIYIKAEEMISSASTGIDKFSQYVNSIVPTQKVVFKP